MEYRPLKITLISAEDLEDVNLVFKMDVYAVVTINGDPQTELKTLVDKDCGSNPKWNYTITFIVEEAAANQNRLNLVIRLWSKRLRGGIVIGDVLVPIKEFLDCEEKVFVYNVRLPNGKEKGTLKLCGKIGKKFSVSVAAPLHETERVTSAETPVVAYPAAGSSAGYPTPPSAVYPYNCPLPDAYPPQQPPHWCCPPTPAQGPWYTGPLSYARPEYMPAQQPAAGSGQAPAGRLFGNLYIVGMLSDILAKFTNMVDGGLLECLFDS